MKKKDMNRRKVSLGSETSSFFMWCLNLRTFAFFSLFMLLLCCGCHRRTCSCVHFQARYLLRLPLHRLCLCWFNHDFPVVPKFLSPRKIIHPFVQMVGVSLSANVGCHTHVVSLFSSFLLTSGSLLKLLKTFFGMPLWISSETSLNFLLLLDLFWFSSGLSPDLFCISPASALEYFWIWSEFSKSLLDLLWTSLDLLTLSM